MKNKYLFLQNITRYSFVFAFVFAMVLFLGITMSDRVYANQHQGTNPAGGSTNTSAGGSTNTSAGGGINNKDVTIDVKINNPLGNISTVQEFIERLLNIVITIGVPIVALAIIYTGFLFVTAQGNADKLKTAKNALVYTLIGAALVLGAWVLAKAIVNTVNEIKLEAN